MLGDPAGGLGRRSEDLDAIVVRIGDVDVARGVHRDPKGVAELPVAAAGGAPRRGDRDGDLNLRGLAELEKPYRNTHVGCNLEGNFD